MATSKNMANKIINQSGTEVWAVGQDGSHARNLVEFDITLPKLVDILFKNWRVGSTNTHSSFNELNRIMINDKVPKCKRNLLYHSAVYYFTVQKT